MGRLRIAVTECNYKEVDRKLKEQLIHALNDNHMQTGIIHEVTTMKDINIVTSEKVLAWAR